MNDPGGPGRLLDARQIFATLNRHAVDYLVIGGFAVIAHRHVRATRDVDLVADPAPDNLRRLAAALEELNARPRGVDAELLPVDPTDPEQLAEGGNWTLVTDAGRLDFFADPAGAVPYPQLAARAIVATVESLRIPVVGLDDLIRMKRAAGREQDLQDIAALTTDLDSDRDE